MEGCAGHIDTLQYIPLLLYRGGSELNLPLEVVFLSVCIRTLKKKERTLACVKAIRFIIFLSISLFLLHFLFSLCGRGNPKSPYSFPLNVGPIKHICGFSY